ncbi:MAG: hypothetical protein JKY96_03280 [Phycisphaerales bacterium]|nr:hypothetical protein [Phycisphaerales bacterium]
MSITLKHSALAWVLIVTQLGFCVAGQGLIVLCHDEGGSSHIELARSNQWSNASQDNCGQASIAQDGVAQSVCTSLPCVDEEIGITFTVNSRRTTAIDSLTDLFPNAPPLLTVDVHHPDSMVLIESGTDFEVARCLIELQCSIRTTILVL